MTLETLLAHIYSAIAKKPGHTRDRATDMPNFDRYSEFPGCLIWQANHVGQLTSEILCVSEIFIRRWDFGLEILAQIYLFVLLS